MLTLRKAGLLVEELPAETILYNTSNHRIHCLQPLAALIWRHCDGCTSRVALAALVAKENAAPANLAAARVDAALAELARTGLLEPGSLEPVQPAARAATRRQALKGLAMAAMAAL